MSQLTSSKTSSLQSMPQKLIIGNRIPKDYFVTSGYGESEITIHAGSYDAALKEAGIHNYNVLVYSSILPKIANRIEKPTSYDHGSVAEIIVATESGGYGHRITAGIVTGWIVNKKTGERLGGLVAEYHGNVSEDDARNELLQSIHGMFAMRYGPEHECELQDIQVFIKSAIPKKKYGTVLIAIVFTSYEYPILEQPMLEARV